MWAETVREKRWDETRTVKLSAPFSLIDADVLFLSSTPLCWAWLLQNVNELWNKIKKKLFNKMKNERRKRKKKGIWHFQRHRSFMNHMLGGDQTLVENWSK